MADSTPGPWTDSPGGVFCSRGTICASSVGGATGNDEYAAAMGAEALANMRLIASAPDLLAAAIEAEEILRNIGGPVHDQLRSAIARAKGGGK